jgi:putative membrane protein
MNFIITWLVITLALVAIAWLIPGIQVATWGSALVAGLVIGLINAFLKPIVQFITLPITALLFWLASLLVPGFVVATFLAALLGSLLLSLILVAVDYMSSRTRLA